MRPKISAILSQTQATFSATKSENTPKIPKIRRNGHLWCFSIDSLF